MRELLMEKFNIDSLEVYDSFWKKFRGLMFSKPRNIVFDLGRETRFNSAVHMFFVFFPLEVYWLDSSFNIVDQKRLKPFQIRIPKRKARYVVEIKR